jgi:surfeit locus 1 family protein
MKLSIGPTVMTICCVGILASFGTWQMKRLEWKNDIIEKLNAGYEAAAASAPISKAQLVDWSMQKEPLGYGKISGQLQRDKAVLLGPRMEEGRVGYHLLLPVTVEGGKSLIVNAGWVSDLWKDNTEERLAGLPIEPVTIRGVIHKPDWSSFASKNSPDNDMWFRADIDEIAGTKEIESPYPFVLYADGIEPALIDVEPHAERWLPRNKHSQYALFWYALAVVMMGVYGFYVAGYSKKKAPQDL